MNCTTFCGLLDDAAKTGTNDSSGIDSDLIAYLRETCRQCPRRTRRKAIMNIVLSLVREETGRQAVTTL